MASMRADRAASHADVASRSGDIAAGSNGLDVSAIANGIGVATQACGLGIARAVQGRHRGGLSTGRRLWSWKRPCCLTRESGDSSSLMGDNSAACPATSDPVLPTFVVPAFPNT